MRKLLLLCALVAALLQPQASQARHAYRHYALFYITGYTWTGYRTSSGAWPRVGYTVAVDHSLFRYGQRFYIAGLGWRVAQDTGGAVGGYHLDVFVGSVAQAYAITGYRGVWWS